MRAGLHLLILAVDRRAHGEENALLECDHRKAQ